LRTFDTSYFQAPGRMNVYNELPFKVILDYAHNPVAIQCMVDLASRLETEGRQLCVLSAPGDRRDEDVQEIAKIAANANFAHIVLRRDDHPRGRDLDEIPNLLRRGLVEAGYPEDQISVIPDEQTAIHHALDMAKRNDLLLIFGDHISRSWKQIVKFKENRDSTGPSVSLEGSPVIPVLPEEDLGTMDGDLISDARGVRLARELND